MGIRNSQFKFISYLFFRFLWLNYHSIDLRCDASHNSLTVWANDPLFIVVNVLVLQMEPLLDFGNIYFQ